MIFPNEAAAAAASAMRRELLAHPRRHHHYLPLQLAVVSPHLRPPALEMGKTILKRRCRFLHTAMFIHRDFPLPRNLESIPPKSNSD